MRKNSGSNCSAPVTHTWSYMVSQQFIILKDYVLATLMAGPKKTISIRRMPSFSETLVQCVCPASATGKAESSQSCCRSPTVASGGICPMTQQLSYSQRYSKAAVLPAPFLRLLNTGQWWARQSFTTVYCKLVISYQQNGTFFLIYSTLSRWA